MKSGQRLNSSSAPRADRRTLLSWLGPHATVPSPPEAMVALRHLAGEVRETPLPAPPRFVAGGDAAYARDGLRAAAAIAVWDVDARRVVASATVLGTVSFPYLPALFALREAPLLLAALARLDTRPDMLMCDGQGRAHPARCGLACVVGVAADLATVGCAKSRLIGTFAPPGPHRGDRSPLLDGAESLGMVLRTRDRVRPLFVSVGHAVTLDEACTCVLRTGRTRLPEPIRAAHSLARQTLAREIDASRT